MRFAQNHSSTHGSWTYSSKSRPNAGYLLTCRYVHAQQLAYISKLAEDGDEKFNYTSTCAYCNLLNEDGNYNIFKTNVERDFNKKTFIALINYIRPACIKSLKPVEKGFNAAPDDSNGQSADHSLK